MGPVLWRMMRPPIVLSVWLLCLSLVVGGASQAESYRSDPTQTVTIHLPLVVRQPIDTPGSTLIPPADPVIEQSIADQLNQHRDDNGLASLTLVSELTQAARRHALDMAENDFTGHTGSDGSNAGERMRDAGYDWVVWGEIIGWGFGGSAESMVNWWMNSPTHRSIILSSRFEDFGVGYMYLADSDWGHYWTVVFGTPAPDSLRLTGLSSCTSVSHTELGGSSLMLYVSGPCP